MVDAGQLHRHPAFRSFLEACDEELAFLVRDHGFLQGEAEQQGWECSVPYHRPEGPTFRVFQESGSAPWIVVAGFRAPGEKGPKSTSLHLLARKRIGRWVAPSFDEDDGEDRMQRALRRYADLLRGPLADLLGDDARGAPPPASDDASDGGTGSDSSGANSSGQPPAGSATRRAGVLKLAAGSVLFALVFAWVYARGDLGQTRAGGLFVLGIGAPGALALAGLLEIVTERPFAVHAERWDALPRGRKFLLSAVIIALAVLFVFGPLLLIGWLRGG